MNLEGKTCGVCNKGKLKKFQERIAEGVYVDAYKCEHGHVSYSEEVMRRVEALERGHAEERHIVKVGSSLAALIPAAIVKQLNLKSKESVFVSAKGNTITIKVNSSAG
ncbi:hypothetical protein COX86_04270 [Candidatus Micrarchaeota archaeon CG_4_10_14_0_2_um_filter_60_11]|nr:MAG: hypothetical protein COU39_03440 [Candidatus Micrarchaeota archaeon CG10_big_fil_rev_8_21_14_0_10_60_32]PIZ90560.1 MAG: hypothetical protein COX86_04270 [Candidatus Micrarchaeota archaeon CG_4_10_14_0_2_um_filter_60_11]